MAWIFFLIASCVYIGALTLRHAWFQTSAWDLGIFDQAIYLISQGLPARSSLLNFHILGDHGALVLYPLGWLSHLMPSVSFLFLVQGICLSSAVFPIDRLSRKQGLSPQARGATLGVLLLYPVIFNTAIFDFHPEVVAFPLIVEAMVLLKDFEEKKIWRIFLCLTLALTCKVSISLFVIGIGGWIFIDGRKKLGISLFLLGFLWLILIGGILIPFYGGEEAHLIRHASKFGFDEVSTVEKYNLFSIGTNIFERIFSIANAEYLLLLSIPVLYLSLHKNRDKFLFDLVPFIPLLLLNLVAEKLTLKNVVHHYSLFIVPSITLIVQKTLGPGANGLSGYPNFINKKTIYIIIAWSVISFIIFSRMSFFFGTFQDRLDTTKERKEAIAMVRSNTAVVTSNDLVPHLSRRKVIALINRVKLDNLHEYEQVLIDKNNPGWESSSEIVEDMLIRLNTDKEWVLKYSEGGIILFDHSNLE